MWLDSAPTPLTFLPSHIHLMASRAGNGADVALQQDTFLPQHLEERIGALDHVKVQLQKPIMGVHLSRTLSGPEPTGSYAYTHITSRETPRWSLRFG